ncbi:MULTISPECIES: LON peptidase substrate-binding domain-containing protein [unclassified Rathayibacter]|uniref:LON peptidase substrate-binding domain-containing protein n=1 Tax=unclassified Rathayibacter TaxID=2609250 RepID=UPI0018D207B4|nr:MULTISPECIES: LON peptidase substrate-binding domain-containing protein [unclassified Rathayibacter]
MPDLPMFPLGSVLLPHMPLPLRLFEPRYLRMLGDVLEDDSPSFGVVLIERGQEVGGGDQRFTVGTVARILNIDGAEAFVTLDSVGQDRFEVVRWYEDDPYPKAEVRHLDPLEWSSSLDGKLQEAESAVRMALAVASEFVEQRYGAVVELAEDPAAHAWQLAGVAPVTEIDRLAFLRSTSMEELLEAVRERSAEATESFRAGWA